MNIPILFCGIFFSGIFWIRNTVDLTAWSLFEIAATLLAIRSLWMHESPRTLNRTLILGILLFMLYATAGLFWSQNFHATLTSVYKLIFAALLLFTVSREPEAWADAAARGAAAASLVGATFALFPEPLFSAGGPNLFSGFLSFGAIVCLNTGLNSEGKKKAICYAGALWILAAQLRIGSLAPVLACLFAMAGQYAVYKKTGPVRMIACGILFLFLAVAGWQKSIIFERKKSDPYAAERVTIWKDSFRYFSNHAILGTGLGTFRDFYPEYKTIQSARLAPYAHSEPLNALCELGILGGLILAGTLWAGVLHPIRKVGANLREPWAWILAACLFQSLLDFNLRYPPTLAMCVIAGARMMSFSSTGEAKVSKMPFALFLGLAGILMALPGLADAYFRWSYFKGNPEGRGNAARIAARIDPFNAFYRSQTGRMRDLLIAIDLEPRNVWFRGEAARFYAAEWRRTGDAGLRELAMEQYQIIQKHAPNSGLFEGEMAEISAEKP